MWILWENVNFVGNMNSIKKMRLLWKSENFMGKWEFCERCEFQGKCAFFKKNKCDFCENENDFC